MQVNSLEDTVLWKYLKAQGNATSDFLAANVLTVCGEACERMKAMSVFAPQLTLHDQAHLLRTTELMSLVLGKILDVINPVEIALLILAAHFHDQGMVPDEEEYRALVELPEFKLFRDNWYIDHPNRQEIDRQIQDAALSKEEIMRLADKLAELDSLMFTDYLRTTHAVRSAEFIHARYANDKRLEVARVNLSDLLAKLCASHCQNIENLMPSQGFNYDEQIGQFTINMPFLALVLRLSDILDFDRDRTPDSLYRTVHFTNDVSIREWEKHRGVTGWSISSELIRFSMQFHHPIYEATARHFMDWIDTELSYCHRMCSTFPPSASRYKLLLPEKVDRSRIGPIGNAYIYHDLEFSLSRDEIIRLLMTDKLYSSPSLCIRELLQNSLDALRYRKALFTCSHVDWPHGRVEMQHSVDIDGYEIIVCKDNGVGMDEKIITRFLCNVGRSYYRSPEFEQQRIEFRKDQADFDPCSQFGIGFMSCFMLGDRIRIETRRDYGAGKEYGSPMVVEINGLNSLLVIKEGHQDQPAGTTVTITSRKKPSYIDEWEDKVRLTTVLKGYALAAEFPIYARCTIPEISDEITIPPVPEPIPTLMEFGGLKNIVTFEQPFSEIDDRLGGKLRESFLLNENGLPCIKNSEASWKARKRGTSATWELYVGEEKTIEHYPWERDIPVCIDGILLAGPPGRPAYYSHARYHLGWRNSNVYTHAAALLDVRGELKPEMTPARIPVDFSFDAPVGWRRLQDLVRVAEGRLWAKVVDMLNRGLSHEEFWKLGTLYNASLLNIPYFNLWKTVAVSTKGDNEHYEWIKISDLGKLYLKADSQSVQLMTHDNKVVTPIMAIEEWEKNGEDHPSMLWRMTILVLLMSSAAVEDGTLTLMPTYPDNASDILSAYALTSPLGVNSVLLPFVGEASEALTLQTPLPIANRRHSLSQVYMESKYLKTKSDIQAFAAAFVPGIAGSVSLKEDISSLEKPGYWHKRIAHRYFAVNWSKYKEGLKPPYKIWLQDKGWSQIDEDDFRRWKDLPLKN